MIVDVRRVISKSEDGMKAEVVDKSGVTRHVHLERDGEYHWDAKVAALKSARINGNK